MLDLESQTKSDAIIELIHRADVFASVCDLDELNHAVLEKEKLTTTGFGRGVAIAHGVSPKIRKVALAVGLSKKGIEFDSFDGEPVHILFLIANPEDENADYLDTLSTITTFLREEALRKKLQCCGCVEEVLDTINEGIDLCTAKRCCGAS